MFLPGFLHVRLSSLVSTGAKTGIVVDSDACTSLVNLQGATCPKQSTCPATINQRSKTQMLRTTLVEAKCRVDCLPRPTLTSARRLWRHWKNCTQDRGQHISDTLIPRSQTLNPDPSELPTLSSGSALLSVSTTHGAAEYSNSACAKPVPGSMRVRTWYDKGIQRSCVQDSSRGHRERTAEKR